MRVYLFCNSKQMSYNQIYEDIDSAKIAHPEVNWITSFSEHGWNAHGVDKDDKLFFICEYEVIE